MFLQNISDLACHSPPGEEGRPAGGALGLDVVLLEDDALVSQVLQVGGDDGGVVPGHVIVAQVICQDEDNVRRTSEECQTNGMKVEKIYFNTCFVCFCVCCDAPCGLKQG